MLLVLLVLCRFDAVVFSAAGGRHRHRLPVVSGRQSHHNCSWLAAAIHSWMNHSQHHQLWSSVTHLQASATSQARLYYGSYVMLSQAHDNRQYLTADHDQLVRVGVAALQSELLAREAVIKGAVTGGAAVMLVSPLLLTHSCCFPTTVRPCQ
jgi:hypothetical protein